MKNKLKPSRFFIPLLFALFFYLITVYQDTAGFQATMGFLFNPEKDIALPLFWQKNRMWLLGAVLLLLAVSYLPTWNSYKDLIQIYRNSPEKKSKPSISPLQASYLYQQDKVTAMTSWLIGQCCLGCLSLRYRKGIAPWSFRRGKSESADGRDKKLIDILFQNDEIVHLKPSFSDPHPDILRTAEELNGLLKEKYSSLFYERQSGFPAWLLLVVCIGEIPFYIASLEANMIATLPVTLFSTMICIAPATVFAKYLVDFFNGPRGMAIILLALSLLFVFFGQSLLFSSASTASYWACALYPNIVAMILTLLYLGPLLPRDSRLLSDIIAYRKYLARDGHLIQEKELPWTIGLGVHSGLAEASFQYGSQTMVPWLRMSSEDDVQQLMKRLHQTFMPDVNRAVCGERKNSRHRNMGGSGSRGI
jgi:hypothetical protein